MTAAPLGALGISGRDKETAPIRTKKHRRKTGGVPTHPRQRGGRNSRTRAPSDKTESEDGPPRSLLAPVPIAKGGTIAPEPTRARRRKRGAARRSAAPPKVHQRPKRPTSRLAPQEPARVSPAAPRAAPRLD